MNKKSQGISINVIIIVAIALIVLVVLVAIFTGRMGGFVKDVSETENCATRCEAVNMLFGEASDQSDCQTSIAGGRYLAGTYEDVTAGRVCCCVPVP